MRTVAPILEQPATRAQLEAAFELIALALEEEPDPVEQEKIREEGAKVTGWMTKGTGSLGQVRELVGGLQVCALPLSELYLKAGAWLALRENGGEA